MHSVSWLMSAQRAHHLCCNVFCRFGRLFDLHRFPGRGEISRNAPNFEYTALSFCFKIVKLSHVHGHLFIVTRCNDCFVYRTMIVERNFWIKIKRCNALYEFKITLQRILEISLYTTHYGSDRLITTWNCRLLKLSILQNVSNILFF